jgi:hypothetical protein
MEFLVLYPVSQNYQEFHINNSEKDADNYEEKLIISASVIVVLFLVVFFVAGYFLGNVPLASAMLGSNKPKDPRVKITVDNAYSGMKDLKCPTTPQEVEAIQKNPKSYTTVKATLTQDEASSLFSVSYPSAEVRL